MADEKIRYVLDVDDKGTPKLVRFGQASEKAGKQAENAMSGAGQALQDVGGQIPLVGNAMSTLAGGPMVAAVAAAAALVGGFAIMVSRCIDAADGINDLSLQLGVSAEQLSVLSLYAEQSGTDIETLAGAMGKLGVKLANGDKDLKKIGITANTADEALFQVADAVAKTENPMERLKIATDAFGKSGQKMLPLLVQGGDALREMGESAPVVSTELAKMADEYNDNMAAVKGQFTGIANQITEAIMPAMIGFSEIMLGVAQYAKDAAHFFGIMSASQSRADERMKIIDRYAELMEKRKAAIKSGAMTAADFKGKAITFDGKTLKQALEEFDAETEKLAAKVAPPPLTPPDGDGNKKKKAEPAFAPTFELGPVGKTYYGADVDKAAAAFAERRKQETADRLKAIEDENRATADLSKRLNDNAVQIAAAEKARLDAIDREKKAKAELLQMDVDAAEERLKIAEKEATAFQAKAQQELAIGNSNITAMIRGRQNMADTIDNIESAAKDRLIQKGLEYVEEMIAQQLMLVVFGDTIKAAEAAKAAALGAQQAAAYAPAAVMASTASFGGAAVAGGASLAAVLASFAFADRGSSTLQGGRRMIVGESRPEEFRPTVPGQIHNTTNNSYGNMTFVIQGGGDSRAIAREVKRALSQQADGRLGGSH